MIDADTEPQACPEAIQMTAVLLLGIRGPEPYCPTPRRHCSPLADPPEVAKSVCDEGELGPMDPIMTTAEACHMTGLSLQAFKKRVQSMGLEPYGWQGRSLFWSEEQVREIDQWRA